MINMIRVTHYPEGDLWPEGPTRNFVPFHAKREVQTHTRLDGQIVTWNYRFYDPYSAYGTENLPQGQPQHGRAIDNVHWAPSTQVLDRMVVDLENISKDCQVLWWDSAIQCFPYVAQHLKRLFRLTILNFGDDLPGSSDVKTFPVISNFDTLAHFMYMWDFVNGKSVPDAYAERGLSDCRFVAWGPMQSYSAEWFSQKVQNLRNTTLPIDLIWLGNSGIAPHRKDRLRTIIGGIGELNTKFYGNGMPHGWYSGTPADFYSQSTFGLNIAESSFFNGRFADLFMSGTIQVAYDPHGEFARFGFIDGVHYLSFDGTADGLLAKIRTLKDNRMALGDMAEAARQKFLEYRAKYDDAEVISGILVDYADQIKGGR